MISPRKIKIICALAVALLSVILLSSCVGTQALFVSPSENGYPYKVTYDALGGNINTIPSRTVFYADNSLLFKPQGAAGMLVEPKNGAKVLVGWYTAVETVTDEDGTVHHHFADENLWDFDNDRISSANTVMSTDEKTGTEIYSLTLYANWIDAPTLLFVDADDPQGTPLLKWNPSVDAEIQRPTSSEPTKKGFVLLDYYMDPECTVPAVWEGENSVSIDDIVSGETESSTKYIYCKFLEGDYIRVRTVTELKGLFGKSDDSIIIGNDLNLEGASWTKLAGEFSGTIIGNGYTISNFTINVKNKPTGASALTKPMAYFGFFEKMNGATVSDLNFKDITIQFDSSSNCPVSVGTLCGIAENSTVTNCSFENITFTADKQCKIDIHAATIFPGTDDTVTDSTITNTQFLVESSGTIDFTE